MTIEGYFDGTAVRPLEPVDLKPQQKVFIDIPEPQDEIAERKKKQLAFFQDLADHAEEIHEEEESARKTRQKKQWTNFLICFLMMRQRHSGKK